MLMLTMVGDGNANEAGTMLESMAVRKRCLCPNEARCIRSCRHCLGTVVDKVLHVESPYRFILLWLQAAPVEIHCVRVQVARQFSKEMELPRIRTSTCWVHMKRKLTRGGAHG